MKELNDLFEEKMKDVNVVKIAKKAGLRFKKFLSDQEISNCINIAVWKALKKHDQNCGLKFTTYVYRGVVLECTTQKKKNFIQKNRYKFLSDKTPVPNKIDSLEVKEVLEELQKHKYGQMVVDKYLNNYSSKEIATKNSSSTETIRKKIKKTIENVKTTFG